MIVVRLNGQTGNNMFQYIAARYLAEKKDLNLLVSANLGIKRSMKFLANSQLNYRELDFFPNIRQSLFSGYINCVASILRKESHSLIRTRHIYRPPHRRTIYDWSFECFDETFFDISDDTILDGYFQSENYFDKDRAFANKVFTIDPAVMDKARDFLKSAGYSCDKTVIVHIRRGDYARMREPFTTAADGWMLPHTYYERALSLFPKDIKPLFVSLDRQFVRDRFGGDAVLSPSYSVAFDLALLVTAKNLIASNSTLSWWGGYLGEAGRRVIAPKFWMGWEHGRWMPEGIEVNGWEYIDAL